MPGLLLITSWISEAVRISELCYEGSIKKEYTPSFDATQLSETSPPLGHTIQTSENKILHKFLCGKEMH